jgi:hypothetical protein
MSAARTCFFFFFFLCILTSCYNWYGVRSVV